MAIEIFREDSATPLTLTGGDCLPVLEAGRGCNVTAAIPNFRAISCRVKIRQTGAAEQVRGTLDLSDGTSTLQSTPLR